MNRKILMVCYYFPPLLDVGCKRSVAFSKYLKAHGWEPHVLSVRNPDRQYCMLGTDPVPLGVPTTYISSLFSLSWIIGKLNGLAYRVVSLFGLKLKRNYFYDFLCIPDFFIGWIPGAIAGGYRIIKKQDIGFIYISCSPFSSAIAGIVLKKLTGKPLIIDFRDPLAVNIPDTFGLPLFRKKINIKIEQKIIEFADIFIVNTEEVRKGFINAYPDIANKTVTIHNGFDSELLPSGECEKFNKFTLVYGGNMYLNMIESQSFFEAIASLKENNKIDRGNFQFLYFGNDHLAVSKIAEKLGILEIVKVEPSIAHSDLLKILMQSHLQLLRIVKPMISTKLFEGIALNLPFLATIPQGEVADIIAEYSPASYVISEDSPKAVAAAIIAAMTTHRQGTIVKNLVPQFLERFSRENMTRKLEKVLEN